MAYTFTFDAEIEVPRTQNPELSRVLSCQPAAGQKTPKHALPTARTAAILMLAFLVYSTSFSHKPQDTDLYPEKE